MDRGLGDAVNPFDIDLEHALPFFDADITKRTHFAGVAGVIDQDIDPPETLERLRRGFRLRLKIQTKTGWVVQDFRSGEIRIDRPIVKKKAAVAPKKKAAAKTKRTGS